MTDRLEISDEARAKLASEVPRSRARFIIDEYRLQRALHPDEDKGDILARVAGLAPERDDDGQYQSPLDLGLSEWQRREAAEKATTETLDPVPMAKDVAIPDLRRWIIPTIILALPVGYCVAYGIAWGLVALADAVMWLFGMR